MDVLGIFTYIWLFFFFFFTWIGEYTSPMDHHGSYGFDVRFSARKRRRIWTSTAWCSRPETEQWAICSPGGFFWNDGNDFVMWIWLVKHVEGSVCFFSADCSSRSKVVCSELILLSAWIRAAMPSRRVRAEWLLDHCRGLVGSCSFPFQSTEGTRSYSSYFKLLSS